MATRHDYLWGAVALILFLFEPILAVYRVGEALFRYAWDVAFAHIEDRPRPDLIPAPDVGPLQLVRTRSFLERCAVRIERFLPAGCPVPIAA